MQNQRKLILDAAEALFAARGFDGTSTRMIAERAGVNVAMLTYYFDSKEGVFLAAVRRMNETLSLRLQTVSGARLPWRQRLAALMDVFLRFLTLERPQYARMVFRELSTELRPDLNASLEQLTRESRDIFASAIEEGVRSGQAKEVDTELILSFLLGTALLTVGSASWVLSSHEAGIERRIDSLMTRSVNHLINLVQTQSDPDQSGPPDVPELDHDTVQPLALIIPAATDVFGIGVID